MKGGQRMETVVRDGVMIDVATGEIVEDGGVVSGGETFTATVMVDDVMLRAPESDEFVDESGETVDYVAAPELAARAARLIEENPEMTYLHGVSVIYLWRAAGGKSGGRPVLGATKRVTGILKFMSRNATGETADYVIWLAADHHEEATDREIERSLYHELMHIGFDPDTGAAIVRPHEFAGFMAEIDRYGDEIPDIRGIKSRMKQLALI